MINLSYERIWSMDKLICCYDRTWKSRMIDYLFIYRIGLMHMVFCERNLRHWWRQWWTFHEKDRWWEKIIKFRIICSDLARVWSTPLVCLAWQKIVAHATLIKLKRTLDIEGNVILSLFILFSINASYSLLYQKINNLYSLTFHLLNSHINNYCRYMFN